MDERPVTGARRLLCLACGTETTSSEPLDACPGCGDQGHVPADLDETATLTITKHELRILTFWAAARAEELGEDAKRCMGTILDRLGTQTDAPLSLSQEIADLREAFPRAEVTVTDSTGTELDL